MEQLQLVLKTDLNTLPKVIEWNYDELHTFISKRSDELVKEYEDRVIGEEDVKCIKSERAGINKLITALEESRKDLKRRCLEPYNDFEGKCKSLVELARKPIEIIDNKLKRVDDDYKSAKYKALEGHFNSIVGDSGINFDLILNPKWANKTNKLEDLKGEIEDQIDRVKDELKKLSDQYGDTPYYAAIVNKYKELYNFSAAVVLATTLKMEHDQEQKRKQKAEEALKAAQAAQAAEEQRIQQMAVQPEPVPMPEPTVAVQPVQQTAPASAWVSAEELKKRFTPQQLAKTDSAAFSVTCTLEQIIDLREYMHNAGIAFKKITNNK